MTEKQDVTEKVVLALHPAQVPVALALDRLIVQIGSCAGDYRKLSPDLLRVAGDNPGTPYDGASSREASRAELSVYLVHPRDPRGSASVTTEWG